MSSRTSPRKRKESEYQDLITQLPEHALKPAMRELVLTDLYFLLFHVCGRDDLQNDWLFHRCQEVQKEPNFMLDLWAREHCKLEKLSNKIRTYDGWSTIGELKVGQHVYAPNGKPVEVIALNDIIYEEEMYEVEFSLHQGKSVFITVGHQHLWDVQQCIRGVHGDVWEDTLMSTREIARYTERELSKKRQRWLRIPVANAILFEGSSPLPFDPYTLGVWLGDGCSDGGQITNCDDQLNDTVAPGSHKTEQKNTYRYTVPGLTRFLRQRELIPTSSDGKFIPNEYLNASFTDRVALFQGLMDTDGTVCKSGQLRFHTISPELADNFESLAKSLGITPSRYTDAKEMHVITFSCDMSFPPFKLDKHLEKLPEKPTRERYWHIKSVKRVEGQYGRCIQVEGGRYVTGTDYIPTHNSTIITYGLTMQDMLYDPEVTIGIFSLTAPISKKFLEQIRQEFTKNNLLKWLFDDVLWQRPQKEAPKWSKDEGLVLKRKGNPKEATLEAHGLTDSLPTGRHFNIRVYDDVIDARNVSNPEMIQKAIENWELSLALGSAQPLKRYEKPSIQRYIGTRYHFNDPYGTIMKRNVATPRIYPGTDNGQVDGEPVLWTHEYLNDMREWMGRYTFSCQILQDPVADEQQGFSRDWLQFWKADHVTHLNLFLLCDPASQKKRISDYTAFAVVGLGADGNIYIVTLFRDRLNLTERTNWLIWLHRQYNPLAVGYEKYGKDSDIEHIQYVMERENYRFPITALGGNVHKEDRIKKLVPDCENNRFYLPMQCLHTNYEKKQEDMTKVFISEEYVPFPVGLHDDMMDCISRIKDPELAAKYPKQKKHRKIRRSRSARVV